MNPKLVKIVWKDAFEGPSGWVNYEDYTPEPVNPVTVGWWFDDDKLPGYITVYSTHFGLEEGELVVADPNHIPKDMVITIQTIDF